MGDAGQDSVGKIVFVGVGDGDADCAHAIFGRLIKQAKVMKTKESRNMMVQQFVQKKVDKNSK